MLVGLFVFVLLLATHVAAWFVGVFSSLWAIKEKNPRIYAELVNERKRGGKDALSS